MEQPVDLDVPTQSDLVRQYRVRSELHQAAFARKIGWAPQVQSDVEAGRVHLGNRRLLRLATQLQLTWTEMAQLFVAPRNSGK